MTSEAPLVVSILPPHEGFGPGRAGAIGTIVHAHARSAAFHCLVFGGPQDRVFPDVAFRPVRPARWFPGNSNLRFGAALLGPLLRLRPALIEVHNRPELALFLARLLPHRKVALFLHNDPQAMRRARGAAARTALLHRLAGVVTVSDHLRRRLLEGVPATAPAPMVLPNGIALDALPPAGPREDLVLFVGRVVADKGADIFVAACGLALPHLPGWRAEILGADHFRADAPDTAFVRQLRPLATAAGVHLAGYREHAAILQAMARAAIVVVPSRWEEPFGLVALEAMASGSALICSPRGGLPEVAGDAALYVEPAPAAVARAIRELADDPVRRAVLAEAGRRRAAGFGARRIGAQLDRIRNNIIVK